MTVGLPRELDRDTVPSARERTAVRLEQDLVLPGVDTDPRPDASPASTTTSNVSTCGAGSVVWMSEK